MAQINKPNTQFNTVLWTGASDTTVSVPNFTSVDFAWIKNRTGSQFHRIIDRVRGNNTGIYTNDTAAQGAYSVNDDCELGSNSLYFDVTNGGSNVSGGSMVAWCLNAGGTAVSNTDGSITSSVSANTTSGFSIVGYTGTNTTATVGHGLGATPKVVIYKNINDVTNWYFTTTIIDGTHDLLFLNTTEAQQVYSVSVPTSSVLNLIANNDTNGSGENIIAYCFAEKKGFSKFGSYTGNGSTDGTFVYTGFKPAMIIAKNTESTDNWIIIDNKRANTYNPQTGKLLPNDTATEDTTDNVDFLSNGFKLRETSIDSYTINRSGNKIIYMAFAEHPLVGTNNIPTTAR